MALLGSKAAAEVFATGRKRFFTSDCKDPLVVALDPSAGSHDDLLDLKI
jgi:hypothetical protein